MWRHRDALSNELYSVAWCGDEANKPALGIFRRSLPGADGPEVFAPLLATLARTRLIHLFFFLPPAASGQHESMSQGPALPELPIRILFAQTNRDAPDQLVPPHGHPFFQLEVITRGSMLAASGGHRFRVTAGMALFSRPHQRHGEPGEAGRAVDNILVKLEAVSSTGLAAPMRRRGKARQFDGGWGIVGGPYCEWQAQIAWNRIQGSSR